MQYPIAHTEVCASEEENPIPEIYSAVKGSDICQELGRKAVEKKGLLL